MAQQKDINEFHVRGRLVKDAETRMAGSKSVTKFTVATSFTKDKSEFHSCEAWGNEYAASLRKGDSVETWGYIHNSSWLDKTTGAKKYATVLVVNKFVDAPLQPATASPKSDESDCPF